MRRFTRAAVIGVAAVIALAALLGLMLAFPGGRTKLVGLGLRFVLWQRGYHLASGDLNLQAGSLRIENLHVTDDRGELIFSVKHVALDFDSGGLLGHGDRKFGMRRLLLDQPRMLLIRRDDGSWNFEGLRGGGNAAPAATTTPLPQPAPGNMWRVRIIIQRGAIEVLDPQAVVTLAKQFSFDDISATFSLDQGARSDGSLSATLRTVRGAAVLRGRLLEDDRVSYGQATLDAAGVPIAPLIDGFAPTRSFVVERGSADIHLQAYTVGDAAGAPHAWHVSGDGVLRAGQLRTLPLVVPLRDLQGRLHYQDGLLSTQQLTGFVAGVPLRAYGAIRLLGGVRLALAVTQRGSLERERSLFAFSRGKPVNGPFAAAIRIDGPVDDIHVAGSFQANDAAYAQALLRSLHGSLYYSQGHVTVNAFDLASSGAKVWAGGDFDVRSPDIQTMVLVQAQSPAGSLPYAANINPTGSAQLVATFAGPVANLSGGGYAQLVRGNGSSLRTFFNADLQHLSLGPLLYRSRNGDLWVGTTVARTTGRLASFSGEIIASHAGLHVRGGRVALADVRDVSASLPSLDTTLDGAALIDGDGVRPDIAVDLRASPLVVQGVEFGSATLVAGGAEGRVHVARATLRGPSANATVHGDLLVSRRLAVSAAVVQGDGSANLAAFAPALPTLQPQGQVNGTFSAAFFATGFLAGAQAHSANASIAGVSLRGGSIVVDRSGATTSLLANADAAGSAVWALGQISNSGARSNPRAHLEAFTPRLDLSAVKSLGTPLRDGTAVGFATLDGALSAPNGTAAAVVRSSFANAPLSGDLDVRYAGTTLRSNASRVVYAGNRATIDGSVSGAGQVGSGTQQLALDVTVRNGDLAGFNRVTRRSAPLTGSYNATVHVGGSASLPLVDGSVEAAVGTIRGVTFNELRGRLHASPGAVALSNASLDLGRSEFAFDGNASRRTFHIKATSSHVDMTDFNDFFGGADVFAGTGDFNLEVARNGGFAWAGKLVLDNAAIRDYPLGDIDAIFNSKHGALAATISQNGAVGAADIAGTALFRPTSAGLPNLWTATYRLKAKLRNVDLAAALPLIHQENLGLSGRLDAEGQMTGTLRNPVGSATIALHGGHLRHTAIDALNAGLSSDAAGVTLTHGDVTLPYLSATAQGRYTFEGQRLALRGALRAADLAAAAKEMGLPGSLGGSAVADVSISGTLSRPLASASVNAGRATVYGIAFDSANINATYAPGAISIGNTSLVFAGNRGRLSINGELPLQLQPLALGPKNRPVELTMQAAKIDLSVLNPLIGRYASLTGNLNAGATISGNAGNPIGKGTAQIRYASVHSPMQTVPVTNLNADIGFDRDAITLRSLTAKAGNGAIEAQGAAHIVPAAGLRSNAGIQFWSRIGLHGAQVDVPGWIRGTLDGQLSMTRSGPTPYVEGSVALSSATIPFSAIYDLASGGAASAQAAPAQAPGVPPLRPGHTIVYGGSAWGSKLQTQTLTSIGVATPAPSGVALPPVDVKIALTAGKDVHVRGGNAIDLTAAGGLVIGGNLRAPTLEGQFYAVRGQVGYFDTNFRLVSGTVTFDPLAGLLPTMDVTAVTNVSGAEITLHITGRVDNLNTELSSNPQMSRDEIVATLLHAPQLATLTGSNPGQAQTTLTQTAQSYFNAQLSRSLLYPFESALAQQLNIESVSFIFDARGNVALEVRKRFTNSISAVYQTTLSVPVTQSYGVSYRLRDYLSLDLVEAYPNLSISSTNTATINLRYQFH